MHHGRLLDATVGGGRWVSAAMPSIRQVIIAMRTVSRASSILRCVRLPSADIHLSGNLRRDRASLSREPPLGQCVWSNRLRTAENSGDLSLFGAKNHTGFCVRVQPCLSEIAETTTALADRNIHNDVRSSSIEQNQSRTCGNYGQQRLFRAKNRRGFCVLPQACIPGSSQSTTLPEHHRNDHLSNCKGQETSKEKAIRDMGGVTRINLSRGGIFQALEALLNRMEASAGADGSMIAATCLRLAELCDSADENAEKILSYGQRALRCFKDSEMTWEHASCLYVVGYATFKMGNFEEAVVQLEQSAKILDELRGSMHEEREKWELNHAVEVLLGQSMATLGRHQKALPHFMKALAMHEKILEPGNPELGASYLLAAEALKEAKDPDEAICFCFKALEIYSHYYGPSSSQVADVRRLMSMVYFDLREFEDALCEYEAVRPIFSSLGKFDDVASMDLASVESLLQLERFKEAIEKLKGVVEATSETCLVHSNALIMLARCFSILKKDKSVDKYCKRALISLEQQKHSLDVGISLITLALVHQRQQDYDEATSVYKKALEILNQCSEPRAAATGADVEGQIGFLLLQLENVDEAMPYLERSVAKKKSIHGPVSEELLDVYNHLGVAYSEIGKLDESLEQFKAARKIVSENSLEVDALTISVHSNLANMYSVFGRFDEAVECQKIVVDSIRRHNNRESLISLEDAEKILSEYLEEAKFHRRQNVK